MTRTLENTNGRKRIKYLIATSMAATIPLAWLLKASGYPQPSTELSSTVSEAAMQSTASTVLIATVVLMLLAISWQVAFGLGRRV